MTSKTRSKSVFVCQQCGNENPKWMGRCESCGEWNSLVEMQLPARRSRLKVQGSRRKSSNPVFLQEIKSERLERRSVGLKELDRVLGGGLVEGQVVLLAGEPGIGKSTLLLQVAAKCAQAKVLKNFARAKNFRKEEVQAKLRSRTQMDAEGSMNEENLDNKQVLYVCGEESPGQIKIRAQRLGVDGKNILLYPDTNVENVVAQVAEPKLREARQSGPLQLIIVDSIQALESEDLTGIPGSIGQVRLTSQKLISVCKSQGIPLFIVGQVTKEGSIAGPKVLEHAVDTVLYLEGERMEEVRILRCFKNRFGAVDELAVFCMGDGGLEEITNASKLFLNDEEVRMPGAVLTPVVAGLRVLLVEIQSLVVATRLPNPRRVTQGFSRARLEMIAAILQKHLRLPLYKFDIFINVSGGLVIDDPAADLAVALSIVSSLKNKALAVDACAFGELTLLSAIRPVLQKKKRIEEARRLGLKYIYSSDTSKYLSGLAKKIFS